MLCVPGSLKGVVAICLIGAAVVLSNAVVLADPPSADGSVVITATIESVHIIVVDGQGTITEILSNGPSNVTPSVHEGKPGGEQVALTPAVYGRYEAIMLRTDQHKTGVVYKLEGNTSNGFASSQAPKVLSILFVKPFPA